MRVLDGGEGSGFRPVSDCILEGTAFLTVPEPVISALEGARAEGKPPLFAELLLALIILGLTAWGVPFPVVSALNFPLLQFPGPQFP